MSLTPPDHPLLRQIINIVGSGTMTASEKVARVQSVLSCMGDNHVNGTIRQAAAMYGVAVEEVMNMKSRHPSVVTARWEAWYQLRHSSGFTLPAIARVFGTCHSTVHQGICQYMRKLKGQRRTA